MPEARADRSRLRVVFLPAMLCDEELYRPQLEGLRDLIDPLVLTVAEATIAEAAVTVLREAPPRFLIAGTSYGGNLALEVVIRAPARVGGLWLMGCNPGPASDPIAARKRNDRVQRASSTRSSMSLPQRLSMNTGPTLRTSRTVSVAWRGWQARPSSYDRTPPSWAELTDEAIWRKSPARRS